MGPPSGPRPSRRGCGGKVYGRAVAACPATLTYSITANSAPPAGSLRSAAVGAQLPPLGTGPVPITHRTAGATSAGSPLTCHPRGV
jgi:hypothetical protein